MEQTYTPEASADGKRNAYNLHCHLTQQYRPYAACLNIVSAYKAKDSRLETLYPDCFVSVGKCSCPAVAMQAEEKEQGKAIYFKERNRFIGLAESAASFLSDAAKEALNKTFPQHRNFGVSASKPEPSKSTPLNKSSVIDRIDTGDYAAAINSEVAKIETPAAPVVPVEVKKGESILEMARRMMQQQSK